MTKPTAPLDWMNFFLADVRDGLGPYLAIYLLTVQKWDAASIGVVMSIGGIAGLLAQTPAGVLIDTTRLKRTIVIGAAVLVTVGSLLLPFLPQFSLVALMQAATGASGAIFAPAIASITLGIVGPKAFARRVGRNEAFNHAGNATTAVLAGGTAYFFGPIAIFWIMAAMALASIVATLSNSSGLDRSQHRARDDRRTGGEARAALALSRTSRMPPAVDLRGLRDDVPLCQRGNAPVGRSKTRAC